MLQSDSDLSQGASRLRPLGEYSGSLANRTYHSLRDAILNISYQPGEALRKAEICAVLGVSRSPVAEAMAKLASDGLVDVVPQAGTFVARFSMVEIQEGAFLREAIELAAIEVVAPVITDDQLTVLRRNFRVQEVLAADGDHAGFYAMDQEMHEMILGFTGYRKLSQVAETAWVHADRARQLVLPMDGRAADTLQEHRAILDALAARDAVAARDAMRAHLRQLMTFLLPLEQDHPNLFHPS